MLNRDAGFALAAAGVALLSLIISAFVLRDISVRQAEISGRLQRHAKVQDEIIRVEFKAADELNYSSLYLAFYELYQDHPRADVLMQYAGQHFYKSYAMSAVSTYREDIPEGLEDLRILQSRLAGSEALFKKDFQAAVSQTRAVRDNITEEKRASLRRLIGERDTLQLERERLDRKQSRAEFLAISIQALSILLVLVKDAFKPKKIG